ncbi:MAG: tRNA (adenosine(37)-N6)-dimethylallyltransferase MiaA [Bacteroidota bacterium]|nr:tRNA (adenosine(37)-N6)-dimethylallyltransferase MiaA [Bacteroidota bacterium]
MITLLGPTASGKTRLAAVVADKVDGEIISADSRQVYRGMDIGTGKDLGDYLVSGKKIPVHLVDIADPREEYNIYLYQKDFRKAYMDITGRGKMPVLCGGSGMYLESVLKGYNLPETIHDEGWQKSLSAKSDKELAEELMKLKKLHGTSDIENRSRIIKALEIEFSRNANSVRQSFSPIPSTIFGLKLERELQKKKITERLRERLRQGMVDEVSRLIKEGIPLQRLKSFGLEYRYVTEYLSGEKTYNEMFDALNIAIHQFSKRQMTWFRRMERNGTVIHWLDASDSLSRNAEKIIRMMAESSLMLY